MTQIPVVQADSIHEIGDANGGELITVRMQDRRGRAFILTLPFAQAQAMIAPLMGAVSAAHGRQVGRLGSDQAVIDHLSVAGFRPTAIDVAHMIGPNKEPDVLLRLKQNGVAMINVFLSRESAADLAQTLQHEAWATPRDRFQ